ncbi:MAG: ribbon-helix-helix protein, CopG family [Bosea sp. (in: a-proteobacteria)]|uniref:ribbon-helix-helix domain-containing protein n=1 Tax=Bosea sp. (in: a-proteobacteria) TaxID=1871050 RepID=UPI0022CBA60B|nr:ribbon-helix-helix protein, CopG family [Bosea sp. (in: a-proteobacteria)]MCZ8043360.1 ribbon-helix-helix protein, CopG family [Beijerinckiaceae bacterium]MDP3602977.1 ribbon-helix-helix protein, CopG family [Bosea sp. (in: a-proteobacteria)]
MKQAMKNITITLPDDLYRRMRVEAAREGKSMSKFMAELAENQVGRKLTQRAALDAFLAGPDLPGLATERVSREDIYGERVLHRYERDAVSERLPRSAEAGDSPSLDQRARRA